MFKILDGRESFYQWDTGQKLIVEDETITEVHFCNRTSDCALTCAVYEEDGLRLVNIPDVLFQNALPIRAFGFRINHTVIEKKFTVNARSKPEEYVFTEEEVREWEALAGDIDELYEEANEINERLTALEEDGGGGSYLIKDPNGRFTDEDKAMFEKVYAEYKESGTVSTTFYIYNKLITTLEVNTYNKSMLLAYNRDNGSMFGYRISFNAEGKYSYDDQYILEPEKTVKDWIWVGNDDTWYCNIDLSNYQTSHAKIVGYWDGSTENMATYDISTSFGNDFNEEDGTKYYVSNPYRNDNKYYFNNWMGYLSLCDADGNSYDGFNGFRLLGYYYWG